MTVGVEKLNNLAAGDKVRARYRMVGGGAMEIASPVKANDATRWWVLVLPVVTVTGINGAGAELGLRQLDLPVFHDDLVEVVSVTKPPYAQGAEESRPQAGDVVCNTNMYGFERREWMYCPMADIPNDLLEKKCEWLQIQPAPPAARWFERKDLPDQLRLVRRLQDWPVVERKWDSDREFEEGFARAQRMIAAKIRSSATLAEQYDPSIRKTWTDASNAAASVVERFDLDDAYSDPIGYSDTWQ